MMQAHHFYFALLQQITPETTILTPNRRLSATLHKLYQQYQATHQCSWLTPDILPLSSWLQRIWQHYTSKTFAPLPLLLNTTQERFLWENIVLSSNISEQLIHVLETADTGRAAWNLLRQWQIDIHLPIFASTDDYLALQQWSLQFEETCEKNAWIAQAHLADTLSETFLSTEKMKHYILVGFTEISPQLNHFLIACKHAGNRITHFNISNPPAPGHRISLANQEDEFLTIARWAKQTLAINPAVSIACVMPALDKIRDRVMQVFSEVFADENTYTINPHTSPFNLSAGKNLLCYPIINTAFQLLALHKNTISIESLSYLFTSPFLGEAEKERIKRAHADRMLRQANLNHLDLTHFINPNPDSAILALTEKCPYFCRRIREFLSLMTAQPKLQSYSKWAKLFCEGLKILGWPGERSLNSEDYQIVDCWFTLLNEYMTLEQIGSAINLNQALITLYKMASKMLFQAKTPDAPIQILGILEAASLPFDYLWIAGVDDLSWPPQPRPNPFIPKSLQREKQMPHATAERELLFCRTLIQQFKQSSSHIIFSHAKKIEELTLQASPLIRDLPEITLENLTLPHYQSPCQRIYASKQLEYIIDDMAPPLSPTETIRGGINVIKQQALCPFKAFAEWRLHAHELEYPLPGLRAKDRGIILHKALEIIWNQLQDHYTLSTIAENELNNLIQASIQLAMVVLPHSYNHALQYISLEKQRLHKLIWDWLQIEKFRPPFKVLTNEQSTLITLNQLTLSIRIDRIDELEDGKKIIIDYKAGKNNDIHTWFSDRPEEPQLPLYLLLDTANTSAITFAQLSAGEQSFKGVSRYSVAIKGIKLLSEIHNATTLSWEDQLKQWHTILNKISDDFYFGLATVDPKHPTTTCLWCSLKALCRINEHSL